MRDLGAKITKFWLSDIFQEYVFNVHHLATEHNALPRFLPNLPTLTHYI